MFKFSVKDEFSSFPLLSYDPSMNVYLWNKCFNITIWDVFLNKSFNFRWLCTKRLLMYFSSSSGATRHGAQWVHCVRSPRDIEEKATHQGDEAKPEVILIIIIFWEAAAKLCRKLPTLLDITSSPSPLESAVEAKLQGDQIIQDLYFKLGT